MHLAKILKTVPSSIDPQRTFEQAGMESVLLLELHDALQTSFETLPKTALFEYDTPSRITVGVGLGHHADALARVADRRCVPRRWPMRLSQERLGHRRRPPRRAGAVAARRAGAQTLAASGAAAARACGSTRTCRHLVAPAADIAVAGDRGGRKIPAAPTLDASAQLQAGLVRVAARTTRLLAAARDLPARGDILGGGGRGVSFRHRAFRSVAVRMAAATPRRPTRSCSSAAHRWRDEDAA